MHTFTIGALALLLAACSLAPGPAPAPLAVPPAPHSAPLPAVDVEVRPADPDLPIRAGADPLEGEQLDAAAGVASESASSAAGSAEGLPRWLRPVRVPAPPTIVGTGREWPKRVGLQVGHWANEDLPDELERLRGSGGGAVGGGYSEAQVNYDLAQRTAALLRARGVEVDVIPATVPRDYSADAFVAIHADGDARGVLRGYKIARSPLSHIPAWDDALVEALYAEYGRATGLPRDDDHITTRMRYYYAFNNRRYYHAIATGTPAVIVEAGFMTSAADRAIIIGQADRAAAGLAAGILRFLGL